MRNTFHYLESQYGRTYADVITKISRMDIVYQIILVMVLRSRVQGAPLKMLTEIDKFKRKIRKSDLAGHLLEDKCGSECTLCSS